MARVYYGLHHIMHPMKAARRFFDLYSDDFGKTYDQFEAFFGEL